MYCPSCSTQAIEGAKFCKTCGMNLNVVTQALSGEMIVSDPLREREFKRARKEVSEGIHGAAVGTALLIAAALPFILNKAAGVALNNYITALALVLALGGIIKLFRSFGSIVDAKVGQKLLDPSLQMRATGGLNSTPAPAPAIQTRNSQRLGVDAARTADAGRANLPPQAHTRPVGPETLAADSTAPPRTAPSMPLSTPPNGGLGALDESLIRPGTGRINRERSTPLRRLEKDDDLMSKLRN